MKLPTDKEIENAKREIILPAGVEANYEQPDCVRIVYAWLDAQPKLKTCRAVPSKSKVASWSGRYVTTSDVYLAAHLHPDIIVKGKKINISRNDIRPDTSRLINIGEAGKHPQYSDSCFPYASIEDGFIASYR